MPHLPSPLTYESIARRVERKQAEASVRLATTSIPVADGFAAYAGPKGYVNRACAIGLEGPASAAEVDQVIDFFTARDEDATIEVCPYTHPALVQAAGARGFVVKHFVSVLALPLAEAKTMRIYAEEPVVEGVTIERVDKQDDAALAGFVDTAERGFAPDNAAPLPISYELTMKSARGKTTDPFLARDATTGAILAVGGSESSAGMTTLYGAVTVKEQRGRGLQAALIRARVRHGIAQGQEVAVVMTAPGGATERNAVRLGFVMVTTRAALVRPRVVS